MSLDVNDQLSDSYRLIRESSNTNLADLIAIRRDIHAHPEQRFAVERTAGIVAENLEKLGIEVKTGVGRTGVVGILKGEKGEGKVIGVRCDMDALPIPEESNVPYKSQNEGTMHACGHDVHTTIGIGVARVLAGIKDRFGGTVKFIFQPAEEIPYGEDSGAKEMIKDGVLENPHVDGIFAIHVWPALDAGQVGVAPGPAMAAAEAFQINIKGQQSHAAMPHLGRDAILGMAEVISSVHHIISRRIDPSESIAINIGTIEGGTSQSILASEVSASGTVRALSKKTMDMVNGYLEETISGTAKAMGLDHDFIVAHFFPSVVNEAHLDEISSTVATHMLGKENVIVQEKCPMTAEDFCFMSDIVPGHYLKLGVANDAKGIRFPLHNSCFDIDEGAIAVGTSILAGSALTFLSE